jgi:hypothetical protein
LINVNELCKAVAGSIAEVLNAATDVEGGLSALEPLGTCEGNTLDGLIENEFSLTIPASGMLQVSHK